MRCSNSECVALTAKELMVAVATLAPLFSNDTAPAMLTSTPVKPAVEPGLPVVVAFRKNPNPDPRPLPVFGVSPEMLKL